MDAWEKLTSTSSLTPAGSYDAWEHLNAQSGGGGQSCGDLEPVFLAAKQAAFSANSNPSIWSNKAGKSYFSLSPELMRHYLGSPSVFKIIAKGVLNGFCWQL